MGLPVLASRIPGNVGLLGAGYAGYFPVGDEKRLARLMRRAKHDPSFYRSLKRSVGRLRGLVAPRAEARALLQAMTG
jgi:glycosyltransferase involved in cell wall biosynthesis